MHEFAWTYILTDPLSPPGEIWALIIKLLFTSAFPLSTKTRRGISSHLSPAQCLLTSPASHELFMAAEIRNYVKEAARKSLWLGIVNQSVPGGGDNPTVRGVETAPQS